MDELLRIASLIAWATAFVIFLPGAVRGFRSAADDMDWFWMAAAFACANRVTFGITNLFAPELLVLSQIWGVAAAIWLAVVAYKVTPRGWR